MIYHYTDLNAAISIAMNSEVWLTDYRFLNDKEEFIEGYRILLQAFENYHDSRGEYPNEFMDDIAKALDFVQSEGFQSVKRNNIFVSSFSTVPDLLGQWRSYGKYCLELDSSFFRDDEVVVLDCYYLHHIGDAMDYAPILIEDEILPELLTLWERDKVMLSSELSSLLDIYALSFKHQAFSDECETRFVISCSGDDERISFRPKGDILIPYIPVKFAPHLLRSIMIGPVNNQDLACESLMMFSDKISANIRKETECSEYVLDIQSSDIPYRDI